MTHWQQQSHHCGIESLQGFRRGAQNPARSNRTIVGLKVGLIELLQPLQDLQQSHHCGIESRFPNLPTPPTTCSNRTIVGLKAKQFSKIKLEPASSNRTIVGLKVLLFQRSVAITQAAIAPLWD